MFRGGNVARGASFLHVVSRTDGERNGVTGRSSCPSRQAVRSAIFHAFPALDAAAVAAANSLVVDVRVAWEALLLHKHSVQRPHSTPVWITRQFNDGDSGLPRHNHEVLLNGVELLAVTVQQKPDKAVDAVAGRVTKHGTIAAVSPGAFCV